MFWFFYQHLDVRDKLDEKIDKLDTKIDNVEKSLNKKIDNFKECLNNRIELAQDKLGSRIDSLYGFMFTVCGLRRPNEGNDRGEQNQVE